LFSRGLELKKLIVGIALSTMAMVLAHAAGAEPMERP
jgi:hypothetical protein